METLTVAWRRLSSGLWRVPEGDIARAYCAHVFPKLKVFHHDNRPFTCVATLSGSSGRREATCHPLIPAETYKGPEPRKYSSEGREGHHRGEAFRLGPQWTFVADEPTVPEWRALLRVQYADGGHFASQPLYREFLKAASASDLSDRQLEALDAEAASDLAGLDKGGMLVHVDELYGKSIDDEAPRQLGLGF